MLIKIALLTSVILQFGAAIISVGLIRRTKFNISWILISIAFVLMAFRRVYELYEAFILSQTSPTSSWIAVLISFLIFLGTIFIRRIFDIQKQLDRIKYEQESRVLNAVIQTEEKTRSTIARSLHDGLGPILSGTKMLLSSIDTEKLDKNNHIALKKSEKNMDEAIKNIRELSRLMSPHLLKSYGLGKALRHILEQYQNSGFPKITFSQNLDNKRLPWQIELGAYRILCELINNSMKHAGADKIHINLVLEADILRIIYSDDGKGCDLNKSHNGMGLYNIESRLKAINGQFEYRSKPEKGFYTDINIPLQ